MNKEQFTKIKEHIIKLKEDLGPRQTQFILYGFCALLIILILIFTYRPLMIKLRHTDKEFKSLEAQLLSQRNQVDALKKLDLKGRLMQQKEVSFAIDKITETGRALGLKFISITPGELQKSAYGDFKVLPIAFQIKSTYKDFGQFLAYIEEFSHGIAEVKSFSIRPSKENVPELNLELLLNLHVEEDEK